MYDKRLDAMIATAELGSFSKAAKALDYTIPALIKQVNGLEQELGITVFERSRKGVQLTSAGRTLVEDARDIVERSNRAIKRAAWNQNKDGDVVRIGISLYQSGQPILKLVQDTYLHGTDIRVQFVPIADTYESYKRTIESFGEEVDVLPSTRINPEDERNCNMIVMGNPFFCLNVPLNDELAKHESVDVADLANRRILVPMQGNVYSDSARDEIAEGAPGVEFVEFPHYTMDVFDRCAMSGEVLLSKEIWRGTHPLLATVDVHWNHTIPYCLYYPKDPSPATLRFIENAKQLLAEGSWSFPSSDVVIPYSSPSGRV